MRSRRLTRSSLGSESEVRPDGWLVPFVFVLLACLFGWIVAEQRSLALVAVVVAPGVLLLVSPPARVVLMALGPIIFFGGTDEFTALKQLFLVAAGAAFVGSFLRSRELRGTAEYRALRPLFLASTAFFVLAAVSFVVSHVAGTGLTPWLRDISPYLLFATVPYLALDAATTIRSSRLQLLLASAGLLGAFAFAVTWSNNRGITTLPLTWIGFPTVLLPAALASYATAAALEGRRRTGVWLVLAATCFSLLASTGTRSALVLLASPVVIVFAAPRNLFRRAVRLSMGLPLATLAVVGVVASVYVLGNANSEALRDRRATLAVSGGQLDRSYLDRVSQSRASVDAFQSAPLLGIGPGVEIEWRNSFGKRKSGSTVDSPFGYLAKFGLAGVVTLIVVVLSFIAFVLGLARRSSELTPRLALVGFGVVVVLWSILNVPFEDKGLPVGLMLLAAIAVAGVRERPSVPPTASGGSGS